MKPATKRILIVRLGSMGDIVHSLPVLAALKDSFPAWEIDWLVESRWSALLAGNPCLSGLVEVDTLHWRKRPLSPDVWNSLRDTFVSLRGRRYDSALDLQGAIKSAVFCALSGAREVIGFEKPWVREPACAALYTRRVRTTAVHAVEANLAQAAVLGAQTSRVRFPLPEGNPASLPATIPRNGYAVLNPGAGWRSKCWPPEYYASLADALQEEFSLPSVLNCGPGEESLARNVIGHCRLANPEPYMGHLSGLVALLRRSCLMVGPDTGPLHLAAALGVPTLGLFGPTDPRRNGPYGRLHRSLRSENAKTSHRHSSADSTAMRGISPERVLENIRELFDQEERPPGAAVLHRQPFAVGDDRS